MGLEGNAFVFVLLTVSFVAVGVWMYFWSRNQSRIIRRFAESKGLAYHEADLDGLEARVNECVALDDPDLTRVFSRLGDIVSLGRGTLFRAVELLDLNRYGRAEYVNRARVAVWFRCPAGLEGMFMLSPDMVVHQRYPEEPLRVEGVRSLFESARLAAPPCLLSLTLKHDRCVAYLEPALTGAVSHQHLEYLTGLANSLAARRAPSGT